MLERGRIGEGLLSQPADVAPLLAGRCCSPLGLRALMAQDPRWSPPELNTLWTPRELVENYLAPLTRTDLLDGLVLENMLVVDVRRTPPPQDEPETGDTEDQTLDDLEEGWVYEDEPPRLPPLRVTVQPPSPTSEPPAASLPPQAYHDTDIVIDASGCSANGPDYSFLANLCLDSGSQLDSLVAAHAAAAPLVLPEPNFYILGSKNQGNQSDFTIVDGLRQIRDLFALIGGRAGLDLYQPLPAAQ